VVTVKHPVHVAGVPPPGFVTVTFRAPAGAAEAMSTLTVNVVAETNVVEFTVIPEPENVATAPLRNPVPVTVRF
jgi:hypothetical protein